MREIAGRFVEAIATHDREAMRALLAPDVDFRGLTPGRAWGGSSAEEVIDVLFGHWFEDKDHVEAVTHVTEGDDVEDVKQVSYRFAITNDAGSHTAEQHAYYRTHDGQLSYLRIMCSGFRARSPQ